MSLLYDLYTDPNLVTERREQLDVKPCICAHSCICPDLCVCLFVGLQLKSPLIH